MAMEAFTVDSVVQDYDNNLDPSTTLFHRRIEFHLARKSFNGFSDGGGNSGFKLETLNPNNNSNSLSKSEIPRAWAVSGKCSDENNSGLDPEISFRITFRRIGAGLQNLGNTCFLNSVLQCLTYTEPLAAYLQSGRHQTSCRTTGFCALCAIQKHVSRALESTGRILAPKDLVSNLRCISRNFRSARQEDAHEYMVNLLESMHKCCLPSGVPSESPSAYDKSLVHKIFGGLLRSQVKCMQCSFCSNKFDPFLDLSLEIVRAGSLCKALAHFTAAEQLDGGGRQYQCQQCRQKVKALKQLTVHKAPNVLAIHLKRFDSHTEQKIDRIVKFAPTLDLKPFVTGPYDGDLKYTLYGVLVHDGGSTHSGHYYCFVRTSSGMWYTLDDNQVYQVNERKVLEQKAYMLFYVRDRRNAITKKTVDIVQKESMVINALGSKGYNILNHGLKETIQNGSFGKKLNDSISAAIAQKDSIKAQLPEKSQVQIDYGKQVNGPVAAECSSLKKDHPTENSFKVTPKVDSPNGHPVSNLTGGDRLPRPASSFKESNGSLSLANSLGKEDGSSQSNPTVPVVQHESNAQQNSSSKKESDSVVIQTTCNGDQSSGKDLSITVDEPSKSIVLHRSVGETSVLAKNETGKDGGLPCSATPADSAAQNVGDIGEESIAKEADLVCKRVPGGKLHVVKRPFTRQVTRMQLSSNIIFGAGLGRKKKKYRKSRWHSSGKQDRNSALSDLGPSTSETPKTVSIYCSGYSEIKVNSFSNEEKKCSMNVAGNGNMFGVDQELSNRVSQDNAVLSNDKRSKITSSILKLPCSGESRFSNYSGKDHVENGLTSMLARGLEETTVARWDSFEHPSEFVDSRSTESVSIGYVGDDWDEEYDRGKRKKIRDNKITFGGPNPFQEVAIKKAKLKKQKLDRSSSANQPFRI